MVAIVTKATLSLKNLVAKDDGKEESRHDLCNTTHPSTTASREWTKKTYLHTSYCYLVPSQSWGRLRDRNALVLAGKEAFYHMHRQSDDRKWWEWKRKKDNEDRRKAEEGKEQEHREKRVSNRALTHHISLSPQHSLTSLASTTPTCRHGDVKQAEAIRNLTLIHRDSKRESKREIIHTHREHWLKWTLPKS